MHHDAPYKEGNAFLLHLSERLIRRAHTSNEHPIALALRQRLKHERNNIKSIYVGAEALDVYFKNNDRAYFGMAIELVEFARGWEGVTPHLPVDAPVSVWPASIKPRKSNVRVKGFYRAEVFGAQAGR